jgi:hypothetical protein
MIGVLMSLNAGGVFGFLTRAHLDHMMVVDQALADTAADVEVHLAIQDQLLARASLTISRSNRELTSKN